MTKKIIKDLINEAVKNLQVANVFMVYNENYYNLIPVKASEHLFLAIDEDDFIFDGFRISRFRDVKKVRVKNDKCDEIIKNEGLFDNLHIPEINLENWKIVFDGLKSIGKNIIVEYETAEGKHDNFTIGKIEKVYNNCLYMYRFDADGIWQPEPYRIPYTEVTSVTFNSRYINIFSKYIPAAPDTVSQAQALYALQNIWKESEEVGLDKMTPDEINAEIAAARLENAEKESPL